MLLWFHLVIPSFPARIDDMRSRFSALSAKAGSLTRKRSNIHGRSDVLRLIFYVTAGYYSSQ